MTNKPLQLKDIIQYLDCCSYIILYQDDVYIDEEGTEKVFTGWVSDIPWIYLDFYLHNDDTNLYQAISAETVDNKPYITISLVENLPTKGE